MRGRAERIPFFDSDQTEQLGAKLLSDQPSRNPGEHENLSFEGEAQLLGMGATPGLPALPGEEVRCQPRGAGRHLWLFCHRGLDYRHLQTWEGRL
jgi:hypothetical protein